MQIILQPVFLPVANDNGQTKLTSVSIVTQHLSVATVSHSPQRVSSISLVCY